MKENEVLSIVQKRELSKDIETGDDESNIFGSSDDNNGGEAEASEHTNLVKNTVKMLVDEVSTMESDFKAKND